MECFRQRRKPVWRSFQCCWQPIWKDLSLILILDYLRSWRLMSIVQPSWKHHALEHIYQNSKKVWKIHGLKYWIQDSIQLSTCGYHSPSRNLEWWTLLDIYTERGWMVQNQWLHCHTSGLRCGWECTSLYGILREANWIEYIPESMTVVSWNGRCDYLVNDRKQNCHKSEIAHYTCHINIDCGTIILEEPRNFATNFVHHVSQPQFV